MGVDDVEIKFVWYQNAIEWIHKHEICMLKNQMLCKRQNGQQAQDIVDAPIVLDT